MRETYTDEFETLEQQVPHRKKKKKKIRWGRIVMLLLVVALVVAGLYANQVWSSFVNFRNNLNGLTGGSAAVVEDLSTEPFAIMVLGEGTNGTDDEQGADAISLLVINPQNKYADIINVPRDSYVQRGSACDAAKYYDKITNSGEDINCLESTLEELFDLEINYYISINFVSFIKIVDALGGVDMNVPDLREGFENWSGDYSDGTYLSSSSTLKNGQQWCEHDSNRNPYAVCFDKFGVQTVDGEHALALARSRHYDSDFARGLRQTELIKAIANKAMNSFPFLSINNLLDAANGNIKTNISFDQFNDFAKLGKSLTAGDDSFAIRTTQLDSESSYFVGELSGGVEYSYNQVSLQSIDDIRRKIASALSPGIHFDIAYEGFYFDPEGSDYASIYGGPYLTHNDDVRTSADVPKYNPKSPFATM